MEYKVGSKMFHGGQMKKLNSLEIFLYVSMFTLMLWKVVRNEFCKFCEFIFAKTNPCKSLGF